MRCARQHYTSSLEQEWITSGLLHKLARTHCVIAFDVRGHGKSGKPHDSAAYGPEMAWDVVRLLDHLAIAKAHVIGYSMGAHIVARLLTFALLPLLPAERRPKGAGR